MVLEAYTQQSYDLKYDIFQNATSLSTEMISKNEIIEIDEDATMRNETSYTDTIMQDDIDEKKQAGP
ncbi:11487_t:CDS:2, partial [Cetraspora pellucida]